MTHTDLERLRIQALAVMNNNKFSADRRIGWCIWAAKFNDCPSCNQDPFKPCLSKFELRKGNQVPTQWPHAERVDWARMVSGMKQRGYIR